MLGNFSFGDYFKKDAIASRPGIDHLVRPPGDSESRSTKLYFTVFGGAEVAPGVTLGTDEEALSLWLDVGAPRERVIAVPGLKENFWAMGETGPCGPCSELHYDMGPAASDQGHTDCKFGCDCGRYVEIWNLVFMQFNRSASGEVTPLPKPSIDTGMGLERLTAVLQGKISNFDTDIFLPLVTFAAKLSGKTYGKERSTDASLRILADHSRAAAFLIGDGVLPSNDGRGCVLRKIIRRAVRHGRMLGLERFNYFLYEMAQLVAEEMKEPYPELLEGIGRVSGVIKHEEERFAHTIDLGLHKLEEDLAPLARNAVPGSRPMYPGDKAFRLYDTFGLPLDFITDVLRDQGIAFDPAEFDSAMAEQKRTGAGVLEGRATRKRQSGLRRSWPRTQRTKPDFYLETTSEKDCRHRGHRHARPGPANELPCGRRGRDRAEPHALLRRARAGRSGTSGTLWNQREDAGAWPRCAAPITPVTGLIAHRVSAMETSVRVGDRVAGEADAPRGASTSSAITRLRT